ncbi:MAG: GNAT family N-acetyltransferase, partial [Zavarzinella sp.]|nr:GNAT family N-acetyltransferase [Zavarzinella sp.]
LRSHTALDNAVFNKPYFDPAGFFVAEDDAGRLAGFAHAGFGPNDDLSALDHSHGVVCAIAVRPEHRRKKVGTELLRRCEDYLRGLGARVLRAGPIRPVKPFYLGV